MPLNAELKIVEALGPEFAHSKNIRSLATMREREVVDAAGLFVYERFLLSLKHPPSIVTRRSFGYLFLEIQDALRREIPKMGFEQENSLTMLDILMAMILTNKISSLKPILARIDLDGNSVQSISKDGTAGSQ